MGQELGLAAPGQRRATSSTESYDASTPKAAQTASTCSGRVVSSRAMPTAIGVQRPEVDALLEGGSHDLGRPTGDDRGHRVEEVLVLEVDAGARQPGGQAGGPFVDPLGDGGQAVGPVVHGVHRRHDRQQDLRRADVAGRLLPADVLLTGLQGQAVGRAAGLVDRHADQTTGHRAGVLLAHGHEGGVGPAVAEGHAEALRRADDDVGPLCTGGLQQGQGQQIGGHDDQPTLLVDLLDDRGQIPDPAAGTRVLDQHAVGVDAVQAGLRVPDDDLDAEGLGPGGHHLDGLWVALGVDEERGRVPLGRPGGTGPWPRPLQSPRPAARRWPGPCP